MKVRNWTGIEISEGNEVTIGSTAMRIGTIIGDWFHMDGNPDRFPCYPSKESDRKERIFIGCDSINKFPPRMADQVDNPLIVQKFNQPILTMERSPLGWKCPLPDFMAFNDKYNENYGYIMENSNENLNAKWKYPTFLANPSDYYPSFSPELPVGTTFGTCSKVK